MSSGTTTNTTLDIISGLCFGNIYNFFVVSYGSEDSTILPSDHNNNITVELCKWIKNHIDIKLFISYSALPSTILMFTVTNTSITITWTSSFTAQAYKGYRQCCKLCEQTLGPTMHTNSSISSPYTFTGIDPGNYCIFGLNGTYDIDQVYLDTRNTTTLSSSKVYYILTFTIIMLFSHYQQHLVHLLVISLSHHSN